MPSETPNMPHETHSRLLNRGGNKHLPMLSNEIAWLPKNTSRKSLQRLRNFRICTLAVAVVIAAIASAIVSQ